MLTINQDKELFENFCLKHLVLNTFFYDDEWLTETSIKIKYPLLNVIPQGSTLANGMVKRSYLVVISDLVNVDKSNEVQVLSDTELICFDLLNYLKGVSKSNLLGAFKVDDSISLTNFTEKNTDLTSGHYFDLSISSHIGNYSCNLPISSGNILDENYIYTGGNIQLGDFLVEIKDQSGNVLQSFNTSGEYIVTVLTGIKDTLTGNVTTIIDDII